MSKAMMERRTQFEPRCLATTLGSLPHTDVVRGTRLMFESTPEIPAWVQFPRRALHETMMAQFTEGLPGLVKDGDPSTLIHRRLTLPSN